MLGCGNLVPSPVASAAAAAVLHSSYHFCGSPMAMVGAEWGFQMLVCDESEAADEACLARIAAATPSLCESAAAANALISADVNGLFHADGAVVGRRRTAGTRSQSEGEERGGGANLGIVGSFEAELISCSAGWGEGGGSVLERSRAAAVAAAAGAGAGAGEGRGAGGGGSAVVRAMRSSSEAAQARSSAVQRGGRGMRAEERSPCSRSSSIHETGDNFIYMATMRTDGELRERSAEQEANLLTDLDFEEFPSLEPLPRLTIAEGVGGWGLLDFGGSGGVSSSLHAPFSEQQQQQQQFAAGNDARARSRCAAGADEGRRAEARDVCAAAATAAACHSAQQQRVAAHGSGGRGYEKNANGSPSVSSCISVDGRRAVVGGTTTARGRATAGARGRAMARGGPGRGGVSEGRSFVGEGREGTPESTHRESAAVSSERHGGGGGGVRVMSPLGASQIAASSSANENTSSQAVHSKLSTICYKSPPTALRAVDDAAATVSGDAQAVGHLRRDTEIGMEEDGGNVILPLVYDDGLYPQVEDRGGGKGSCAAEREAKDPAAGLHDEVVHEHQQQLLPQPHRMTTAMEWDGYVNVRGSSRQGGGGGEGGGGRSPPPCSGAQAYGGLMDMSVTSGMRGTATGGALMPVGGQIAVNGGAKVEGGGAVVSPMVAQMGAVCAPPTLSARLGSVATGIPAPTVGGGVAAGGQGGGGGGTVLGRRKNRSWLDHKQKHAQAAQAAHVAALASAAAAVAGGAGGGDSARLGANDPDAGGGNKSSGTSGIEIGDAPAPRASFEEEVLKRQKRLIRNRESACQSRQRKKSYQKELEAKCQMLEGAVAHLRHAMAITAMENSVLRDELARFKQTGGDGASGAKPAALHSDSLPLGSQFHRTCLSRVQPVVLPLRQPQLVAYLCRGFLLVLHVVLLGALVLQVGLPSPQRCCRLLVDMQLIKPKVPAAIEEEQRTAIQETKLSNSDWHRWWSGIPAATGSLILAPYWGASFRAVHTVVPNRQKHSEWASVWLN